MDMRDGSLSQIEYRIRMVSFSLNSAHDQRLSVSSIIGAPMVIIGGAATRFTTDLINLQLIVSRIKVFLAATRKTCERLFSYRKTQPWPPTIVKQDGWDELCEGPAENLPAIEGADDAVRWANELIAGTGSAR